MRMSSGPSSSQRPDWCHSSAGVGQDGELHLLGADAVHLLAHDALEFLSSERQARRRIRVPAGSGLADAAGAPRVPQARDVGLLRVFAQGGCIVGRGRPRTARRWSSGALQSPKCSQAAHDSTSVSGQPMRPRFLAAKTRRYLPKEHVDDPVFGGPGRGYLPPWNTAPEPRPHATPMSAPRASPGPLTSHPMTATVHRQLQRGEPALHLARDGDEVDLAAGAGRAAHELGPAATQPQGAQDAPGHRQLVHRVGGQRDPRGCRRCPASSRIPQAHGAFNGALKGRTGLGDTQVKTAPRAGRHRERRR